MSKAVPKGGMGPLRRIFFHNLQDDGVYLDVFSSTVSDGPVWFPFWLSGENVCTPLACRDCRSRGGAMTVPYTGCTMGERRDCCSRKRAMTCGWPVRDLPAAAAPVAPQRPPSPAAPHPSRC